MVLLTVIAGRTPSSASAASSVATGGSFAVSGQVNLMCERMMMEAARRSGVHKVREGARNAMEQREQVRL